MISDAREHWDRIYSAAQEEGQWSWHQDDPTVSLRLIERFAEPHSTVIDVGGGSSLLAQRLIEKGYGPCTVVDISEYAIKLVSDRLSPRDSPQIVFKVANILDTAHLGTFDLWHDRAVFHFLTEPEDRARYVRVAAETVRPGGHIILATFSSRGPDRCSGLTVCRYDAEAIQEIFSPSFGLLYSVDDVHKTPGGAEQRFVFTVLARGSA